MTILCDSREHKYIVEKMIANGVKIDALSYGDYIVEGKYRRVVIERKEVGDLFASVVDNRLWEQLKGMEKYGEGWERMVLIEGSFQGWLEWQKNVDYQTMMNRFTGIKTSILFGWPGTSIVMTTGMDETISFLFSLNKKIGDGDGYSIAKALGITKSGRTNNEEMLDIICGATGIGEKKGVELFESYRSLLNIGKADRAELVGTIGEKDGEHLYELWRRKWRKMG